MIFKFACPECGQKLEATTEMRGQGVTCPCCALQFAVPMAGEERVLRPPLALLRDAFPPPSSPSELAAGGTDSPSPLRELPEASPPDSAAPLEGVDEEVTRLLAACDPILLDLPTADEPPPTPAPVEAEAATPTPPDAADPGVPEAAEPEARLRRVAAWVGGGVAVLLLVALVYGATLLPGLWRKARTGMAIAELLSGLWDEAPPAEVAPVPPPPQRPVQSPAARPRSESVCFRDLGTQSLGPLPLSEERAVALQKYLTEFPSGKHRDEALVFALREATRAMQDDGELAEEARALYRESGRLVLTEMLSRLPDERQGVREMRGFVAALCREQPSAVRLDWAIAISSEHGTPPSDNASMLLAGLSEQTPESHRGRLVELLLANASDIPPNEWGARLTAVVMPYAFHCAEHKPAQGQSLLRLARRLHDSGRNEDSLHLLGILLRYHPSGEIRDLATRLQLAWDRGLAPVAREGVLEKARLRHRRELPAVLATISRQQLARELGLPWPPPPSPTQSLEAIAAAAAAEIDKTVATAFPDARLRQLREEAVKRYQPFRIGEEVTVEIRRGNRRGEVVGGRYHSHNPSHVRLGGRDVLLVDLDQLTQVRFDPEWCERERKRVIEQGQTGFLKRREASRHRLLAEAAKEGPRAAGYILWRGRWHDPNKLFSEALENLAEAKSKALLQQISKEMFIKAGFRLKNGEWLPGLPIMPEE